MIGHTEYRLHQDGHIVSEPDFHKLSWSEGTYLSTHVPDWLCAEIVMESNLCTTRSEETVEYRIKDCGSIVFQDDFCEYNWCMVNYTSAYVPEWLFYVILVE